MHPKNAMTMLVASLLITESAYLARQLWEHSCRRSFPLGWYGLIVGQSEGLHTNNIPQQYNASLFDYREKLKKKILVVGQLINICCRYERDFGLETETEPETRVVSRLVSSFETTCQKSQYQSKNLRLISKVSVSV